MTIFSKTAGAGIVRKQAEQTNTCKHCGGETLIVAPEYRAENGSYVHTATELHECETA